MSKRRQWAAAKQWLLLAFVVRAGLALFFEVSGVEKSMGLTKDAYLYTDTGMMLAEYWETGGLTEWPNRVHSTPVDCLFEYEVGIVCFLTGGATGFVRLINVLAGVAVPYIVWRTASLIFPPKVSLRALIWSAFFPTQVYYSAMVVRDMQSTLAMCLVFYGLTAVVAHGKSREIAALPLGLLLMLGLRTYMFSLIVGMIPVAWIAATLFIRAKGKARFVSRATTVIVLCGTIGLGIGLESLFSGREGAQITDVNYLNKIRQKLNRGGGALYDSGEVPMLFEDLGETVQAIGVGLYHFVFSVSPTGVSSVRQLMALPEVLLVVAIVPSLWRGFRRAKRHYPLELAAPLLIAVVITFAYSSVATNGGPMMRWRLQTVNVYILVAALGWDRRMAGRKEPASKSVQRHSVGGSAPMPTFGGV